MGILNSVTSSSLSKFLIKIKAIKETIIPIKLNRTNGELSKGKKFTWLNKDHLYSAINTMNRSGKKNMAFNKILPNIQKLNELFKSSGLPDEFVSAFSDFAENMETKFTNPPNWSL